MKPITYLIGDATHPQAVGPTIIAHCCNDLGAWSAGFVLALSKRWQTPQLEYANWAKRAAPHRMPLGDVLFVTVEDQITVANIIGQRGIGYENKQPPIRYAALGQGLRAVGDLAISKTASVHLPRLGCGLAGGEWRIVEQIIAETLCERDVPTFVYDLAKGGAR